MRRLFLLFAVLLVTIQPAVANDNAKLVGVWKLISWDLQFQNGDPARPYLDKKWIGYTIFTAEGRTMSLWEAEGRAAPKTEEDRAALFRSMLTISGTYSYQDGTGVTDVDVAGNPANKGKQTRGYKLEGNQLEITTPWGPAQFLQGSPVARHLIRFQRHGQ